MTLQLISYIYIICFIFLQEKSKEKKVIPGRKEEGKQKKKFTMAETSVSLLISK